jgi:phosphoglucosamine mutase
MARKLFGTDGIRGMANVYPMTAEVALRLGIAVGQYFLGLGENHAHRVVIGKDTRRSGYMLENALTAGLNAVGMDVILVGPVPTPAVGMLTRSMRADLGVMISASHNPYHDNGIKLFGPDGYKLSDETEARIEALLEDTPPSHDPEKIGRANRIQADRSRYIEFAKTTFPRKLRLDGLKIVIDCANGAAYRTAPDVLWELGAQVIPIGVEPDGYNINKGCGSTDTALASRMVREHGADIAICLDGDADRVILLDEEGRAADGDEIMAVIAGQWADSRQLAKSTLVTTVMSNLGLERHLGKRGIRMIRTAVGDRYVVEAMRQGGYNLGGEQSGHIVMTDYVTTGDGLISALQFLAAMIEGGKRASELAHVFPLVPQLLENVRFSGEDPLGRAQVTAAIVEGERRFGAEGRLLIRKSGTEPLIRVMGEHEDGALLKEVVGEIADVIRSA